VGSVLFDYSKQYLATASSSLTVYDIKTWAEVVAFPAGAAPCTSSAFGTLASYLVAGCADGTVALYGA